MSDEQPGLTLKEANELVPLHQAQKGSTRSSDSAGRRWGTNQNNPDAVLKAAAAT